MIDKPENGDNAEVRNMEADPARKPQTATVAAEPGGPKSEPSPKMPAVTSKPESMPAAPTAGDRSAAGEVSSAATEPVGETDFSSHLAKFRQGFEQTQSEFLGEPRAAVEKAEMLIDGLMSRLHDQLTRIHSNVKSETDTEQLRVAMLSYRELFDSLGEHRTAYGHSGATHSSRRAPLLTTYCSSWASRATARPCCVIACSDGISNDR
jgi:hypothetical protein